LKKHNNNWKIFFKGRRNTKFEILFEGLRSVVNNGWIALDDIVFADCALPPTNRPCTSSEFTCNRGSCVDKDRLCDLVDDCGDNSDETLPMCSSYSR
jgi:hypothetical protein